MRRPTRSVVQFKDLSEEPCGPQGTDVLNFDQVPEGHQRSHQHAQTATVLSYPDNGRGKVYLYDGEVGLLHA